MLFRSPPKRFTVDSEELIRIVEACKTPLDRLIVTLLSSTGLRATEAVSLKLDDMDLIEVNEAFVVVTMAAMRDLGLAHDKVNVHGGACALGHPVGASGARIIVTLMNALDKYDLKKGVASLCIGGGEGTALAIERVS